MVTAFLTGFFLGLSLIVAIGAQNAFVLKQGILRQHVFYIALFCSISDALLICLGVAGISYFLNDFVNENSKIIFGLASIWLFIYAAIRLNSVFRSKSAIIETNSNQYSLLNVISVLSLFTFANPHVYLDTVILIGSVSQQFIDFDRLYFAFGASVASFVWFFGIAYGAKLLIPIMQNTRNWRIFDSIIAMIIFIIGIKIASQGGWI